MTYTRCHTCGRYIQSGAKYCSEQCAQRYSICETCGRYYPQGEGYSDRFCSPDCAVQYRTVRAGDARPAETFAEGLL